MITPMASIVSIVIAGGTIWFTQSTNNSEENMKGGLWAAGNRPIPTGGVWRLPGQGDEFVQQAEEVVSHLYLANGITFDKAETMMYVAESMMNRVLRFSVDIEKGVVSNRENYQMVYMPDNVAIDAANNLWIASHVDNSVIVVDQTCRTVHGVFRATSKPHATYVDQWVTASHLGQPLRALVTPEASKPLPGFLTGMFFSPRGDTVYFTAFGNAIFKYAMPKDK